MAEPTGAATQATAPTPQQTPQNMQPAISGKQWIRKATLYVLASPIVNAAQPPPSLQAFQSLVAKQPGLDLSDMQFRFEISASDVETPNSATIRVYNLAKTTISKIKAEYTRVILQAGYENGPFGQIFSGDIKQFRVGRERNVDSYLDILAADSDLFYNWGVVNKTLAPGATIPQRLGAVNEVVTAFGGQAADGSEFTNPSAPGLAGGILPRGKVLFGLAREQARDLARTTGTTWSIQNGKLTFISDTGYLPGDIIPVNSQTGMIGMPETTQDGVTVTTLLNPKITVGQRLKINNADVNTTTVQAGGFPQYNTLQLFADTSADGIYRVLVIEYQGDTRGNAWYSKMVCLAVNPNVQPVISVLARGIGADPQPASPPGTGQGAP